MKDIAVLLNNSHFLDGNISLQTILEEYSDQSQFVFHHPENIILIVLYIPIFLIALIFNVLVIAVFIKYKSFQTVTNCFVMNLSIADLLVTLICMPAGVNHAIHSAWLLGGFICKVNHYLQGVAVGSSVFTLMAMSIDRYLAIRHPLKRKSVVTKKRIITAIVAIWILSLVLFAPILYVRRTDGFSVYNFHFVYCLEEWGNADLRRMFGFVIFIMVYALPGLIIIIAYALIGYTLRNTHFDFGTASINFGNVETIRFQMSTPEQQKMIKERRKVATTLLIIATVFAVCWLPSGILGIIFDFYTPSSLNYDFYAKLHNYFLLMGHFNSLLNPLLYCLMTKNFRKLVHQCFRRERNKNSVE